MSELREALVGRLTAELAAKALEVVGFYGDRAQEVIDAVMEVEIRKVLVAALSDA